MSCSKKSSWSYLFFFLFKHLNKQVDGSEIFDKEKICVYWNAKNSRPHIVLLLGREASQAPSSAASEGQ